MPILCLLCFTVIFLFKSFNFLFPFLDDIINKFSNLRTYYRKQQKLFKGSSGSAGLGLQPRWEHFVRLQFLDDSLETTPSISTLDNSFSSDVHEEPASSTEIVDEESVSNLCLFHIHWKMQIYSCALLLCALKYVKRLYENLRSFSHTLHKIKLLFTEG